MCKRRDSIDALTNAADLLERVCRAASIRVRRRSNRFAGPLPMRLIGDPSTVTMLPSSSDSAAIDALAEAVKKQLH
jgi:hypothetical protein